MAIVIKMFKILREYGVKGLVSHSIYRVFFRFGLISSCTDFYLLRSFVFASEFNPSDSYSIRPLTQDDLRQFNDIKYFGFISGDEILMDKNRRVFLAFRQDQIVGYVVIRTSTNHSVYGLGEWHLARNEGWIGPAYVIPEMRNQGVNSLMILYAIDWFRTHDISHVYTCINSNNLASIRSFTNRGFQKIGMVMVRHRLKRKVVTVSDLNESKLMKKFRLKR